MTDIKSKEQERSTISKVIETGSLIAVWISMSMFAEIYGPTLIDMKERLNTDYETIATAVSGRSVGWFPGSIAGGFLVDKFGGYCHLLIAMVLNIASASTMAIPFSPSMTAMWIFCFVNGSVESVLNIAGTRILFNIWKEKSVGPLMLIHVGYGIGSFIAPLYANPFLGDFPDDDTSGNATDVKSDRVTSSSIEKTLIVPSTSIRTTSVEPKVLLKESKIEYAYAISASFAVIVSIVFYCYQVRQTIYRKRQRQEPVGSAVANNDDACKDIEEKEVVETTGAHKDKTFLEMINPASCAGGRFCYGSSILFFLFLYFGNVAGGDRMLGSFIRSFAIDQLDFSKDEASYLNTSFWIGLTVGRVIFSPIGRFVNIRILIMVETCGMTVAAVLLVIFGDDHALAMWILLISFGFFTAPIWPTGIAWTDYHIQLTGLGMTLQILGASVGGICHLRLIGYLYDTFGPMTFLYQICGYAVLQLVFAGTLNLIGSRHGSRFEKDANEREV